MTIYHNATCRRVRLGDEVRTRDGSRAIIRGTWGPGHGGAGVSLEWADGSVTQRVLASEADCFHSSVEPTESGYFYADLQRSYDDGLVAALTPGPLAANPHVPVEGSRAMAWEAGSRAE